MKVRNAYLRIKNRKWPTIVIEFEDGSQKSFSIHADEEAAKAVLQTIRNRIALGTFVITDYIRKLPQNLTLQDLAGDYLKHRKSAAAGNIISEKTLRLDKNALECLMKYFSPKLRLHRLSKSLMNEFVELLLNGENERNESYSITTINIYLRHLSSAFSWAVGKGYMQENPLLKFQKPKNRRKKEPRYLTDEEIQLFREYFSTKPPWHLDVFNLALWTGLRVSGLVNLREEDLVKEEIDGKTVYFLRVIEKGEKLRYVPLSNEALRLVRKRIGWAKNPKKVLEILSFTPEVPPAHHIERAKQGYLFFEISRPNTISRMFARAKHALGVNDREITFHSTRHTFATKYLENGGDLETLQEILGHASIITTQIYAKITMKKIARNIDLRAKI